MALHSGGSSFDHADGRSLDADRGRKLSASVAGQHDADSDSEVAGNRDVAVRMYFQTWELDDQQPRLSVTSRLTQMRHYRNLGKYRTMLPQYLKSGKFTSIAEHAKRKNSPLASLEDRTCKVTLQTINRRRRDAEEAARLADNLTSTNDQKQITRTAVTLVIPCYNEESTLPYLHRTMQSLKHELSRNWDLKVLFVDDCSKDNTFEVLKSLFGDDSDVRIVKHETNKGVPRRFSPGSTPRRRTSWRRSMQTALTTRTNWLACCR